MELDPSQKQTLVNLWIALGVLIATNSGTFIKMFFDMREKRQLKLEASLKQKEESEIQVLKKIEETLQKQTIAINNLSTDVQRMFTAIKLVAGPKWAKISKLIQEDHPRN